MKTPKRIGLTLFDDELKGLINASAKIFPITQTDVDTSANPGEYEYGRVDNSVYRWDEDHWTYIVADDKDIDWLEIKNKPVSYPPSPHLHDEAYAPLAHTHEYSPLVHLHDERYAQLEHNHDDVYYTKLVMDEALAGKSNVAHLHDDRYYTESEMDAKLAAKANATSLTGHTDNTTVHVTQLDKDVWNAKTKIVIGTEQPTDESLWFQEIV